MASESGEQSGEQRAGVTPSVSVIIPAYNAEGTLAESIDSIISQTDQDWEMIVVDDGSTDGTGRIARAYAEREPRIRVVSQVNGGESAARNTGIQHAGKEWLLFLDSDDWVAPDYLSKMTAAVASHPEFDAVHCGSVRVTAQGIQLRDDYQPPAGDLFPTLARRAAFPVHACIVRKCLVESAGNLDTSLQKCPDWDLWQRIARGGARFGAIREVLAYYRIRPHSSSLEAEQLFRDGLTVLKRGHSRDERVAKPLPEYANGLTTDQVESQVFYLLCWAAGLLLGEGKDARILLEQVRDYHYGALYPDAIAQCILESGTLPASQPPELWDTLLPATELHVKQFLEALEGQSQTPGLAAAALQDMKRRILKHSPLWGSVIEQQDRAAAQQESLIDSLAASKLALEAERDRLLESARLRAENSGLRQELQSMMQRESFLKQELADAGQRESLLKQGLTDAGQRESLLRQELVTAAHQESVLKRELAEAGHLESLLKHELAEAGHRESLSQQDLADTKQRETVLGQKLADAAQKQSTLSQHLAEAEQQASQLRQELEEAGRCEKARGEELLLAQREQSTLSSEMELLAEELEQSRSHVEIVTTGKKSTEDQLHRLRGTAWSRLGQAIGVVTQNDPKGSRPEIAVPARELFTEAPPATWSWEFLVGPRSAALVHLAAGHPDVFRVEIARAIDQVRWDIQLNYSGLKMEPHRRYVVNLHARADRPRTIQIGLALAHDPWANLGLYEELHLKTEWQVFRHEFTVKEPVDNARIHLDLGGRRTSVEVSNFRVQDLKDPMIDLRSANYKTAGTESQGK